MDPASAAKLASTIVTLAKYLRDGNEFKGLHRAVRKAVRHDSRLPKTDRPHAEAIVDELWKDDRSCGVIGAYVHRPDRAILDALGEQEIKWRIGDVTSDRDHFSARIVDAIETWLPRVKRDAREAGQVATWQSEQRLREVVVTALEASERDGGNRWLEEYLKPPYVSAEPERYAGVFSERLFGDRGRWIADILVRTSDERELPLAELALAPGARLVVVGEGGAGKSTMLAKLAEDAAHNPTLPTPVLVELARVEIGGGDLAGAIERLLAESAQLTVEGFNDARIKGDQPLLILLDGLNEAPLDLERRVGEAIKVLAEHSRHRWVVSSRPTPAAEALAGSAGFTAVELARLRPDQVSKYLRAAGLDALDARMGPELQELVTVPFMLWAFASGGGPADAASLPANIGSLYRTCLDAYLAREPRLGEGRAQFDYAAVKHPVLEYLALVMTDRGLTQVRLEEELGSALARVAQAAKARVGTFARVAPDDIYALDLVAELHAGGVIRSADRMIRFMHESVQHYYAACALLGETVESIVARVAPLPWRRIEETRRADVTGGDWETVLMMLAGLLPDATALVAQLRGRHPLLAAACLRESGHVDAAARGALIDQLCEYLTRSRPRWRAVGCWGLAAVGRTEAGAARALLELVRADPDRGVRRAALDALARSHDPVAVDGLLEIALDEQAYERGGASHALWRGFDTDLARRLVTQWREAADVDKPAIETLMARLGVSEIQAGMALVAQQANDAAERDAAHVIGAGVTEWASRSAPTAPGGPRTRGEWDREFDRVADELAAAPLADLTEVLRSAKDSHRRGAAADELAARADATVLDPLLSALWLEDDVRIRKSIVAALARLPGEQVETPLREALTGRGPITTIEREVFDRWDDLRSLLTAVGVALDTPPTITQYGWESVHAYDRPPFAFVDRDRSVAVFALDRRARAARALGELALPAASSLLREVVHRRPALELAAQAPEPAARELRELLTEAAHAVEELDDREAAPLLVDLLRYALAEGDEYLAAAAARALHRFDHRQAVPELLQALRSVEPSDDPPGALGHALHESLDALDRDAGVAELRTLLRAEDARDRMAAIGGSTRWGVHEDLLAEVALRDPEPTVRRWAARSLRFYDGNRTLDRCVYELREGTPAERRAAAAVLRWFDDPAALGPLDAAMRDDADERVRAEAALAVLRLGPPAELAENAMRELEAFLPRLGGDPHALDMAAELVRGAPESAAEIPPELLKAVAREPTIEADVRQTASGAISDPAPWEAVMAMDDNAEAIELCSEWIADAPPYPEPRPYFERCVLLERGWRWYNVGEFAAAVDDLRECGVQWLSLPTVRDYAHALAVLRTADAYADLANLMNTLPSATGYGSAAEAAEAWGSVGWAWSAFLRPDRVTAAFARGLQASERAGSSQRTVQLRFNCGVALLLAQAVPEAHAVFDQALEGAAQLGGEAGGATRAYAHDLMLSVRDSLQVSEQVTVEIIERLSG